MSGSLSEPDASPALLLPLLLSVVIHTAVIGTFAFGGMSSSGPKNRGKPHLVAHLVNTTPQKSTAPNDMSDEKVAPEETPPPSNQNSESPIEPSVTEPEEQPSSAPEYSQAPMPGLGFYPTSMLTKKPGALREIPPRILEAYPPPIHGSLVLILWIDSTGEVVSTKVESSTLPDALTKNLVEEFEKLPFLAGEIDGHAVNTWMRIEIFPQ